MDAIFATLSQDMPDADPVILGDFNTMGAEGRMGPADEIAPFEETIRAEAPGFRLLTPALKCTEYFNGHCGWLDHIVVSQAMLEARGAEACVTGYCALAGALRLSDAMPAAYHRISNDCPAVVEIENRDLD